jgi:integron integrase
VVPGGRGDGRKGRRPADEVASAAGTTAQGEAARRNLDALVDAVRGAIRSRGYSPRTERAYVGWVGRFVRFRGQAVSRLRELDASHARAFLDHLATAEGLAPGSRNQAASALAFMFREVFGRDELIGVPRARGPKRAPVVLSHREVLRVLRCLTGKYFLAAVLLYSAGLRLDECLRLRVKDIDFELRQILVRDGKGRKDRYVPLAQRAVALLQAQIRRVAALHRADRARGHGWAGLPGALHRKDPSAGYELGWQYVLPAATTNPDPATGRMGRRPLHATAVQRQVKAAVRRSGIPKRATCHTFRHSFATEALRGGCDIRTLQHVMGHRDVRTTMIYLHVVEQSGLQLRSPLDRPDDLVDFDPDPIGSPGEQSAAHWELAQQQWHAGRQGGSPSSRSHRRRPSVDPGEPPEGGPDRSP